MCAWCSSSLGQVGSLPEDGRVRSCSDSVACRNHDCAGHPAAEWEDDRNTKYMYTCKLSSDYANHALSSHTIVPLLLCELRQIAGMVLILAHQQATQKHTQWANKLTWWQQLPASWGDGWHECHYPVWRQNHSQNTNLIGHYRYMEPYFKFSNHNDHTGSQTVKNWESPNTDMHQSAVTRCGLCSVGCEVWAVHYGPSGVLTQEWACNLH